MTKLFALTPAIRQEHLVNFAKQQVTRSLIISAVVALTACSSTPLPPWPQTTIVAPSTAATAVAPPSAEATAPILLPVPPSTHLQAQPYSAAISALFPDPSEHYETPGLRSGRQSFTTNSELAQVLHDISAQSIGTATRIAILNHGKTQSGAPIYALVATKAKAASPFALSETQLPTVMVVAGQQGTDIAPTEALLALSQELGANGLLEPLLEKINIIFVPRANPDGFEQGIASTANGVDLRFDHLKLQTPEAHFLAQLVRDYQPSMLVDTGEFSAIEPTLERFNAIRANDIGLQHAMTTNSHEFVTKAARQWMLQPTINAIGQINQYADHAYEAAGSSAASGFTMGTQDPTTLRNTASLKNIVSMEVLSRGSDLQRLHIQRRVHGQATAITTILNNAAQRADELQAINSYASRDVASRACRSTLQVQTQPRIEQRNVTLIDATTAKLSDKIVPWINALEVQNVRTRTTPCGYWLSANAQQAIKKLRLQGVTVQKIAEPATINAEVFEIPIAPNTPTTSQITTVKSNVEAAPGSFYISMNQPLAFLAAAALEADTPYSFHSTGVLSDLKDSARAITLPSVIFQED